MLVYQRVSHIILSVKYQPYHTILLDLPSSLWVRATKTNHITNQQHKAMRSSCTVSGWWLTYPSEKYARQLR